MDFKSWKRLRGPRVWNSIAEDLEDLYDFVDLDTKVVAAALKQMDDRILYHLARGTIWLISVRALIGILSVEPYTCLPRMQELAQCPGALLAPADAAALLNASRRNVFVLSYGWLTREHPDPDGLRIRALKTVFLEMQARGLLPTNAGLFWDYGSLPQKPRSAAEEQTFEDGLRVMADLYSSPLGTAVLQMKEMPRPSAPLGEYNSRPYDRRGWCIFESAVSVEMVCRASGHRRGNLNPGDPDAIMNAMPRHKVYQVSPEGEWSSAFPKHQNFATVASAINAAIFTGKGDQKKVLEMYLDFHIQVH